MSRRVAELAGRWYPATAEECDALLGAPPSPPPLSELLAATGAAAREGGLATALGAMAPHAGWVYSGRVAFEALSGLAASRPDADLVVVFGGHLGRQDPPRLFLDDAADTPYGPISIPRGLAEDVAMAVACELETAEETYDDNAIEVLLPMVKRLWPGAGAILLGVPPTDAAPKHGAEIADLARRRGFERAVFIGSTDLTHYGPNYRFEPKGRGAKAHAWVKNDNDRAFLDAVRSLSPREVAWTAERQQNACCPGAVMALLGATRFGGANKAVVLRHVTSHEVSPSGPPTSFVGYAGVLIGVA